MPAYDYRCEPCEIRFEVVRPVSDRSDVSCPECGGQAKRVFTPVGVVFKGSGFHSTDYRSKPAKNDSAGAEGAKPGCGSSDSSCDACPAKADKP